MCTYKVRTLREEYDLDKLMDGVYQITRDVTGLRETDSRRRGVQSEINCLYEIGKTGDDHDERLGVTNTSKN